ncbi:MAG: division/cell wall cluster transcriptional repressor MraZ [Actinobacteria bacterium]|nr:division/cell wall cluster transcriptional repressor MraZ [Actinomycetota bacterium]
MLLGEYAHTLDDKNRLTLPAKFRESFVGGGVVTRGLDGCLYLFARQQWEDLVAGRLAELDPLLEETRLMNRYFFSGAAEAEPDKQGRINVPPALIEHARLGREVIVAGVQDHLEIWDRAAWREHLKQVEGSAQHVAERLAAKRD